MKNKFKKLSRWSFALSILIFAFTYFMFHYLTDAGTFTLIKQASPGKPMITFLFGIWGVMFLFSSVINLLIAKIFFTDKLCNE